MLNYFGTETLKSNSNTAYWFMLHAWKMLLCAAPENSVSDFCYLQLHNDFDDNCCTWFSCFHFYKLLSISHHFQLPAFSMVDLVEHLLGEALNHLLHGNLRGSSMLFFCLAPGLMLKLPLRYCRFCSILLLTAVLILK